MLLASIFNLSCLLLPLAMACSEARRYVNETAAWLEGFVRGVIETQDEAQHASETLCLMAVSTNGHQIWLEAMCFLGHPLSFPTIAWWIDGGLWQVVGLWSTTCYYLNGVILELVLPLAPFLLLSGRSEPHEAERMRIVLALWATSIFGRAMQGYDGYVPFYGSRPEYQPRRMRGWRPHLRALDRWRRSARNLATSALLRIAFACWTLAWFPDRLIRMIDSCVKQQIEMAEGDGMEEEYPYQAEANKKKCVDCEQPAWPVGEARPTHASPMQRFLLFLMMLKAGCGLWADVGSETALQHVMFCMKSSMRNAAPDHHYDSDSFLIAVNNCSSRRITNNIGDFVGKPTPVNVSVKGIGGSVTATYEGTVEWRIEDNQGRVHVVRIPNTY
jgi:hypothetical protein